MKPGVLIVLILLVISIVTSVLSSLIPVYRIANKSPIDSIKNR
jgi:ABC-type antimicrobial peptide transport system permease subunit